MSPTLGLLQGDGSKTKETPIFNEPIGRYEDFGPKEFTKGSGSKVSKNDVSLMWHFFPTKSRQLKTQRNTPPSLRNQSSSLAQSQFNLQSKSKVHIRGVWTPSLMDTNSNETCTQFMFWWLHEQLGWVCTRVYIQRNSKSE